MKTCLSWLANAGVLVLLAGQFASAQQNPDLATVIDRATKYVTRYEDSELGSLLIKEKYSQSAANVATYSGLIQRRQLESDFLILQVGQDRIGIRKVNRVDGSAVKDEQKNLETLFDDTPEGIRKQIALLRAQNVEYDIGGILRENNVPTFALKVLHESEVSRFLFSRDGTERVNNVQTWKIKFVEQRSPTLLHGLKGESLLSSGELWIEPGTGRVLKTEFSVENSIPGQEAKGKSVVTYSEDKKLGILVPVVMTENWQKPGKLVDGKAEYSNFRSFNVDVSNKIESPLTQ